MQTQLVFFHWFLSHPCVQLQWAQPALCAMHCAQYAVLDDMCKYILFHVSYASICLFAHFEYAKLYRKLDRVSCVQGWYRRIVIVWMLALAPACVQEWVARKEKTHASSATMGWCAGFNTANATATAWFKHNYAKGISRTQHAQNMHKYAIQKYAIHADSMLKFANISN